MIYFDTEMKANKVLVKPFACLSNSEGFLFDLGIL